MNNKYIKLAVAIVTVVALGAIAVKTDKKHFNTNIEFFNNTNSTVVGDVGDVKGDFNVNN